jgi:seryl-tRNA synthetase|tara:strand:+ start:5245 stop:6504 length:1260 start_codon:yes stop_codon:yes gene_type:complete
MINIADLKDRLDLYKEKLDLKGYKGNLEDILSRTETKNLLQKTLDELKSTKNSISKEIGVLASKGQSIDKLKIESETISSKIETLQSEYDNIKKALELELLTIPNLPDNDVPHGTDESFNDELGQIVFAQNYDGIDHVEIGALVGLMDFDNANKLSGSRFVVLKGKLAQLQRALTQFMLDEAKSNGYEEYYVPYIVNSDSLTGTGQLPKFEDDQFKVSEDKYLIPTAEVPLTNLMRNETIDANILPIKMTSHTPCFRAEAGSYGKDTRGMIRQHQFEKVELVKFVHPDNSEAELEGLINDASEILNKLKLTHRKVLLCTGDLGFSAAKTIDLEVWLPSQNCYREISSCSNFRDFQARRMNTKVKDGKNKFLPHTINGSALAVGRTLLAIIENYYEKGVGIRIPKALEPYLDFNLIEIVK